MRKVKFTKTEYIFINDLLHSGKMELLKVSYYPFYPIGCRGSFYHSSYMIDHMIQMGMVAKDSRYVKPTQLFLTSFQNKNENEKSTITIP